MGALKKFEDIFKESTEDNSSDKKQIEAYQKKIGDLLEAEPELQKKAAQILSELINQK